MQTRFANNWLGSKISPANRLDRPLAVAASSVPPCGLCGPPGGQITTSEAAGMGLRTPIYAGRAP